MNENKLDITHFFLLFQYTHILLCTAFIKSIEKDISKSKVLHKVSTNLFKHPSRITLLIF